MCEQTLLQMLSKLVFFFFYTVYNYGNYSNGLGNRWESNSVHLPQWQRFKELSLLGKN